jgi:putative tricarboxylic transport membrane protein
MVILEGLLNLLNPFTLIAMTLGVMWGMFMGATPGFGSALGMALLIPFTFGMDPNVALPMLAGVYAGAIFGGGITAILVGVPGTSSAAATVQDGFAMTRKGQSNRALSTSVISSSFGGIFGGIILLFFAPKLVKIALLFGPAEYFILAIFGLTIIAVVSGGSILKGLICGIFGLLLGTIGLDPIEGESRFTCEAMYLYDGLPIIPIILSLFAFPRCLLMIRQSLSGNTTTLSGGTGSGSRITISEMTKMWKTLIRSSIIGTIIGIIPAAGSNIACWVSYAEAKRKSKTPEKFGTGIPEGVVAAEAANNAVEGGSMIPLLTLSIPGNSASAIMLGALLIHGLVPGPNLFTKYGSITYTYMLAVIFCNFIMLGIGYYASRYFARLTQVPLSILAPIMLLVTLLGSFATRQYIFDIWITIILGTICYLLTLGRFPMPAILLGFILGPIAERGFRRAMLISEGNWTIFLTRPLCLILLILTGLSIYTGLRMNRAKLKNEEAPK